MFISTLKERETAFNYRTRVPAYPDFEGSLWQFLEQYLLQPDRMTLPLLEALDWYSGAFLLETVPTSLLILMRYANDPEQAMLRAVNDTKDNDTIAAIVAPSSAPCTGRSSYRARGSKGWLAGPARTMMAPSSASWPKPGNNTTPSPVDEKTTEPRGRLQGNPHAPVGPRGRKRATCGGRWFMRTDLSSQAPRDDHRGSRGPGERFD